LARLQQLRFVVHQVIRTALPPFVGVVALAAVALGACNTDPAACAGVPVSFACTHVDDVTGAQSPGILGSDGWCSVDPRPDCPRMPPCSDARPGQRCWVNRTDPIIITK
jgi:hypothetical protein